jgi:short-subunit dehydrogenase involved in D-alanine esterification of teichoic acids
VADFSDSSNLEFYENIRQRCADLNVRIVIANAGILDANDVAQADKLRL